jgi:hypothetical protein
MIPSFDFHHRYPTLAMTAITRATIEVDRPIMRVASDTKAESHETSMIRNIANVKTTTGPNSEISDMASPMVDNDSCSDFG